MPRKQKPSAQLPASRVPRARTAIASSQADQDMTWTDNMGGTGDMGWTSPMGWTKGVSAVAAPAVARRDGREITGEDILAIARQHLGESYVLGARAPMGNAGWKGPWDCAEFVSWCLYQASGILFGTEPRNDPVRADAYTGYWAEQARAEGCTVPVATAAATAGAILLRYPQTGAVGHIVFSDGEGGTVEAHSSKDGVIDGTIDGRRWDVGVLVPGIRYYRSGEDIVPQPPAGGVIRLSRPLTKSDRVRVIQQRLAELGYAPGKEDGVYGPQTAHAVSCFQAAKDLVVDGEVGPSTLKALGIRS